MEPIGNFETASNPAVALVSLYCFFSVDSIDNICLSWSLYAFFAAAQQGQSPNLYIIESPLYYPDTSPMLSPVTQPSMLSFDWHYPNDPMQPETTDLLPQQSRENDEATENDEPNENEKETIDLSLQQSRESDETTENDEPNENEQQNQNEEYDNNASNENLELNQNEELNNELDAMQNASVNWENTDAEESRITRPMIALAANDLRNVLNRRRNQQPRSSQNFVRLSVQNRPDRNIRIVIGYVDEYISSFRNMN